MRIHAYPRGGGDGPRPSRSTPALAQRGLGSHPTQPRGPQRKCLELGALPRAVECPSVIRSLTGHLIVECLFCAGLWSECKEKSVNET